MVRFPVIPFAACALSVDLRRHRLLGVLLLGSACAPPTSAWERTYGLCGSEGWGTQDPSLDLGFEPTEVRVPSLDCINAILVDLDVDANAFEQKQALFYPDGREAFLDGTTDYEAWSNLAAPITAARFLFLHDLGMVGDVESSILVDRSFVRRLRRTSGGRRWTVNEALYQILVDDVDGIVPIDPEAEWEEYLTWGILPHARWLKDSNEVLLFSPGMMPGFSALQTLLHEVRHDTGPPHLPNASKLA